MEKTSDNEYKLHQERLSLDLGKKFYSENNQLLEQPPQGCGGIPITGIFQDEVGKYVDKLT